LECAWSILSTGFRLTFLSTTSTFRSRLRAICLSTNLPPQLRTFSSACPQSNESRRTASSPHGLSLYCREISQGPLSQHCGAFIVVGLQFSSQPPSCPPSDTHFLSLLSRFADNTSSHDLTRSHNRGHGRQPSRWRSAPATDAAAI
jgi:hypothetical protein